MAVQVPRLKRGLFGYRPKIVRSILTGREIMFARVWQRLQRTEAERDQTLAELEACRAEIDIKNDRVRLAEEQSHRSAETAASARAEVAELRSLNESLRGRIYQLEVAVSAGDGRGEEHEDLSTVLEVAEEAFSRILDRARRRHEEQLEAIEAARRDLRIEAERLAAWRADAEGILGRVRGALGELAGVTARLPDAAGGNGIRPIHIPEASNWSTNGSTNGSASREDLAAIQELYDSR
jgi:chromosome segregation ATPase